MTPLKYLAAYPPALQEKVRTLIAQERLEEYLRQRYPERHAVQSDKALYAYTMALKQEFLRNAPGLDKVLYDAKLDVLQKALGLHTAVSRVQGGKLRAKKEIRIAALFRGTDLLHPSGSTTLEAGDILCVIGHDRDLPALGKLFSQAPKRGQDLRFFGDFVLEGDAELGAIGALYGLQLDDLDGSQPLSRFIARQIGGEPVVGDQGEWKGLTWTVASMDGNRIDKVGVRIPEGGRPGPGLFL